MNVAFTPSYGPAAIVELRDAPTPSPGLHEVLIQVHASPVTEGDRRIRSADFPGMSALPGRLIMGITGPRRPIGGTMFAGRVVGVGASVKRFAVGDDVFGSTDDGAYAEYLVAAEDGPIARMPSNMSYEQAAAVPYGAGTALYFLQSLAKVQPGESVLILGASGGVGRFAVQLAKHLGATVTGVCSAAHMDLVRGLGADHLIDYRTTDFRSSGTQYDVIFDIADASSFGACKSSLTSTGRYLTVYMSLDAIFQTLWTAWGRGAVAKFGLALPTRDDMEQLRGLIEDGVFPPVIAQRFRLDQIVDAHRAVEVSGQAGTVVVSLVGPEPLRAVS